MIRGILFVLLIIFYSASGFSQNQPTGIRLQKRSGGNSLLIDNKPFLILGGELGNSTASDMAYLRRYWNRLRQMNLNTVLVPVYWELLEPEENRFDFSLVDSLINNARRYDLKLVLLWFGTWKNSMSCYTPAWVKTNSARFTRTFDKSGRSQEILSVFGKSVLDADKKAFASLMKHIREYDARQKTVIMMQVENEIGMLPTPRENSTESDAFYTMNIPDALEKYLMKNKDRLVPELKDKWEKNGFKTEGSWETVFGKNVGTEEIFQAWFYASYVNQVAEAGKKEYDIPMYVNAALPRTGKLPGEYPSASPLPHIMDIWQAAAPSIDALSPDFYNPDTKYWCDLYTRNRNALFIPEIHFDKSVASKVFFVIGHYKAFGFSPFSIESESDAAEPLSNSYHILKQLSPFITGRNRIDMDGFILDSKDKICRLKMGAYDITVSHYNTLPWAEQGKDSSWSSAGGIIIQTGDNEFLVAGTGFAAVFNNIDSMKITNIESINEVKYINGKEIKGRRMNGDEDHQGRHIRFGIDEWGIQKLRVYNSPK
jgi:hypothetical protein